MKKHKPIWKTKTAKSDGDLTVEKSTRAALRAACGHQTAPSSTVIDQHLRASLAGSTATGCQSRA
jgi:hypothetical protein